MSNWKAPGPDMVRGFWFKKFDSLHAVLTSALKECVEQGWVPEWMVKGRTVLFQKDPAKGTCSELSSNSLFTLDVETSHRDFCRQDLRPFAG